jgi:hypothetical protein
MWLILKPSPSQASWDAIDLSLMTFFLGLPIFLTYESWALWTGGAKKLDLQDEARRPLTTAELWAELHLLSPLRARMTAAGAVSLVVGLPLLVICSLGWRAPIGLATPAAYLSAIALMSLGAMALSLNKRDPARAPRWLSSILFLCGTALLTYPEFWTPMAWNSFFRA